MCRSPRLAIINNVVDPSRKRKIRLGVALCVAVLLGVALIYVSFNASDQTKEPSQILTAAPGQKFEMNAKVIPKSVRHQGETLKFEVEDRDGGGALPVSYQGVVPDPFRGGREIVLTGAVENGTFVGEPESLITKCPSKFTTNASETAGTGSGSSGSNG
ncbi:MAG TPA: cytochrome c maturation protein CcmE [Solirubrobacterales bacterium]|nr:cytochrome c maturation protein CcmE [Solirubrobacterales bacterium]